MEKLEKSYDTKWYQSIKQLVYVQKYEKALKFLSEYLLKYPHDIVAYNFYIELLFICGKMDEVEYYVNILGKTDFAKDMAYVKMYFELKFLMYQKEYEKILQKSQYLIFIENQVFKNSAEHINLYAKYKLGLIEKTTVDISKFSYTALQTIDYSLDRLREHLQKHDSDSYFTINGTFRYNNIGIDEIIDDVIEKLDIAMVNHSISFCDYYIFKRRCIGINKDGITTDYLKVVVIPKENSIITIYPISSAELRKSDKIINLDILDLDSVDTCSNKLSQIEKFNQKLKKCKKI